MRDILAIHTDTIIIISDDSENAGYPHRSLWLLSSKENKALRECCWIDRGENLNDCDCCNRRSIEVEFLVEANISCEAPGLHQFGSIRIDWLNLWFTLQEQREKNGLSYLTRHLYVVLLHNTTFNQSNDNLILTSPSGLFQGWEGEE